jgi:8-oxo-dGTP diphosphatase
VSVHEWTVGGAVIEGPEGLLLVRNRRRDGSVDWTPPGGVIDPGEAVVDGLAREVREETGLVVTRWAGLLYEIEAHAPDLGWVLRVEAWQAASWEGELEVADPDGIVDEARWVPTVDCAGHLDGGSPWVAEPVGEWLSAPWSGQRTFGYRIAGTDRASLVVTRV